MNSLNFLNIPYFFTQPSLKFSTPMSNLVSQITLPLPNKVPPCLLKFYKLKCLRLMKVLRNSVLFDFWGPGWIRVRWMRQKMNLLSFILSSRVSADILVSLPKKGGYLRARIDFFHKNKTNQNQKPQSILISWNMICLLSAWVWPHPLWKQ